jgi:putative membrane protein
MSISQFYRAAALALGGILLPAISWAQPGAGYAHGWGEGWHGGGMIWGGLMMILFLVLVVAVIVLLVKWIGGGNRNPAATTDHRARDILRERYARGEIDAGEFEERKRLLDD